MSKGVALITGGAIRIGRAITLALADDGYDIILHYNSSFEDAKKVAKEVERKEQKIHLIQEDISDISSCARIISEAKEAFGRLDILVNNAAIFEQYGFMETDEGAFDRHMNINFKAPFFLTQSFAKISGNGQVINILDTYITRHSKGFFTYLLTKKTLADFTKMAARELAPNIRVNGIALSSIIPAQAISEDMEAKARVLPLEKNPSLDDVTKTLIQLIDNPAITGQILFVDGGKHLT